MSRTASSTSSRQVTPTDGLTGSPDAAAVESALRMITIQAEATPSVLTFFQAQTRTSTSPGVADIQQRIRQPAQTVNALLLHMNSCTLCAYASFRHLRAVTSMTSG